ncbi:hypothetical protein [Spirillospora albida]|uniref:hypothetical protein n=1 Tax=Spirillospora albida TaxID=58123 RepID=UPI0004C0D187|nr:hypothetical protein [Spirillospora albida]
MRLNGRETGLLVGMLLMSAALWAPFLWLKTALGTDRGEYVPRRTPLVDLCIWFPRPLAAELVPDARKPRSQAIFYGEMQCDWSSADERTTLSLSAYRPTGALTPGKEAEDLRQFYDARRPTSSDGTLSSAGLGETSTMVVRKRADDTEARILVRDGLLVVQVTYRAPGKEADVAGKARQAATELLRLLPPKGR